MRNQIIQIMPAQDNMYLTFEEKDSNGISILYENKVVALTLSEDGDLFLLAVDDEGYMDLFLSGEGKVVFK